MGAISTNIELQNALLSRAGVSSSNRDSSTAASQNSSPCSCENASELEKKKLHLRELELQAAKTNAENEKARIANERFKLKMEFIKLAVENNISEEELRKYDNMANTLFD